ncbi:rCG42666 [Rattus norvegicus]|uniref:RCG42666 n=1 Tax=Rattus norvegicus TaxID=10116 RepID=A6K181_RAT|nr:rCG42666 [Rattus norvegicus]
MRKAKGWSPERLNSETGEGPHGNIFKDSPSHVVSSTATHNCHWSGKTATNSINWDRNK